MHVLLCLIVTMANGQANFKFSYECLYFRSLPIKHCIQRCCLLEENVQGAHNVKSQEVRSPACEVLGAGAKI